VINSHPIAKTLIHWYSGAKRDLPWRKTKDPYDIWISEIILQQTRVDQGLPYFERFIEFFPDISSLANASEDEVLAQWQGLGYYSRARNLHATAKHIAVDLDGLCPDTYKELLTLKGVGPYTAAAISSICFDLAEPVVDGNVFRVASRLFGIKDDISKSSTRKVFEEILKEVIPIDQPGEFNQAIMEHGATMCKPRPDCDLCTLKEYCHAFAKKETEIFPVKGKKTKVRDRQLVYLVLENNDRLLMKKRTEKDIWQGLYDFPLVENVEVELKGFEPEVSDPVIHLLSHQKLKIHFRTYRNLPDKDFSQLASRQNCEAFSIKQILTLPKPKIIVDFIQRFFKTN